MACTTAEIRARRYPLVTDNGAICWREVAHRALRLTENWQRMHPTEDRETNFRDSMAGVIENARAQRSLWRMEQGIGVSAVSAGTARQLSTDGRLA
jgi:hypothetical protein